MTIWKNCWHVFKAEILLFHHVRYEAWTSSNHIFCACVCAADDEEEEKINKFFTPVGPPEAQFIEDVTEERIKLGKLARELSQDPELLQAS